MGERATEGSNSGGVRGTPFVSGHGKVPTFIPCRCAFLQACNRRRRPRHAAAKVRTLRTTVRSCQASGPLLAGARLGGSVRLWVACGWPVWPCVPRRRRLPEEERRGGEGSGGVAQSVHCMSWPPLTGLGAARTPLWAPLWTSNWHWTSHQQLAPLPATPASERCRLGTHSRGGGPPRGQRAQKAPPGPAGIRPSPHTGQWQGAMALP